MIRVDGAETEVGGGLYHVITRGNDRQDIFHAPEDHRKFLALLAKQKGLTSFFLYAYCLITNNANQRIESDAKLAYAKILVEREYGDRIAISQV